MSRSEFEKFLRKEKEEQINWDERKNNWIEKVEKLYGEITNWLEEYVTAKKIHITYGVHNITEQYIGSYTIRAMQIFFNNQNILLRPKGTLLIGAFGRIDLESRNSIIKFILLPKDSDGPRMTFVDLPTSEVETSEPITNIKPLNSDFYVWKTPTGEKTIRFKELNEETFFKSLVDSIRE